METLQAKFGMDEISPEFDTGSESANDSGKRGVMYTLGLPFIVVMLAVSGFAGGAAANSPDKNSFSYSETKAGEIKNAGKYNILASEDISSGIKDTVYTDKNCWLELKVDEQMLYQHWRDGHTEKYPVSTGNNKGGDPTALETRPGLFAIFIKVEHHQSSQFNSANMYNFMPFNQGIGFHSIDGTGYYAHLGVRPSSHGCIRMRHDHAKKLFKDCDLGTLVLASRGYTARTVAFAPEGFKNEREYTKEEYKNMLATNLYNILQGKYYLEERERFIIDPKVIPVSGVYVSYDVKIPKNQSLPRSFVSYPGSPDKLKTYTPDAILTDDVSEELITLVSNESAETESTVQPGNMQMVTSTEDLVKKYFHNPIGILPYFGPKR